MGRGFPSERDLRQMQNAAREAARIEDLLRQSDVQSHIYTVQDALEERRSGRR